MTLPSLKRALHKTRKFHRGQKIAILGLDSCTMSTAEVAHEVKEYVDYLVGAEGFVQNAGWPYHRLLETLLDEPDPQALATQFVEKYYSYYSDYLSAGVSTDQSVVHLGTEKWDRVLVNGIKELSRLLSCELQKGNRKIRDALVLAHWEAQSFNNEQDVDLYDFCSLLISYLDENSYSEIRSYCQSIINNWKSIVPLSKHSGPMYQFANGLSIYFPWSEVALDYQNLKFFSDTKWYNFLKNYVDKTCRPPRPLDDPKPGKLRKPLSIQPVCKEGFIGVGGYPCHRAGGRDSVKAGGRDSAKAGGRDSAKYGSLSAEELIQLSCMKNFPVGFYHPSPPTLAKLSTTISNRNIDILKQRICDSPDLKAVIQKLPNEVKDSIAKILRNNRRKM